MRAHRRLLVGLVAAGVVCGSGAAAAVAAAQDDEEARQPLVVTAGDFTFRGDGDAAEIVPIHRFTGGVATVPELVAYAEPAPAPGEAPIATAPNPTHEGFPLVVRVLEMSDDGQWAHVQLPVRPNGTTGWVPASNVDTFAAPNRIEVDVTTHRLRVFDGDSDTVLFETDVATGRPNTPTPLGDFYIDIYNPLGHDRVYGWGQMSVAGFSDVLERFAGGIGQIAIHGWNDYSVMGTAASNGCVRMRNEDIARVAELAWLGSPVRIYAS